jgi:hypothetical protein
MTDDNGNGLAAVKIRHRFLIETGFAGVAAAHRDQTYNDTETDR